MLDKLEGCPGMSSSFLISPLFLPSAYTQRCWFGINRRSDNSRGYVGAENSIVAQKLGINGSYQKNQHLQLSLSMHSPQTILSTDRRIPKRMMPLQTCCISATHRKRANGLHWLVCLRRPQPRHHHTLIELILHVCFKLWYSLSPLSLGSNI